MNIEPLLQKYSQNAPRYTSYPTVHSFHPRVTVAEASASLRAAASSGPVSLYIHLPYCDRPCYFCGCSMTVTKQSSVIDAYLEALFADLELTTSTLDAHLQVCELHLGGGTPNYLSATQMSILMKTLRTKLSFQDNTHCSIEANPALLNREYLLMLRELGFQRISLGVQDFSQDVLEAVNRPVSKEHLQAMIEAVKELGFGLNLDLIYGLPKQNLSSFRETLNHVKKAEPDRIALFQFAYLPELKQIQSLIDPHELPSAKERTALFLAALSEFTDAGYEFIGMDHFARPTDPLVQARKDGTLTRNFQGYAVTPTPHILGLGATAISFLSGSYYQRTKKIRTYKELVATNTLPLERGYHQTEEDRVRHEIIKQLMCFGTLNVSQFCQREPLAAEIFPNLIHELQPFQEDGLLELKENNILVTQEGMVFIRLIAQCADAAVSPLHRLSKAV